MKKKLLLINPITPGKAQFQKYRYSTFQPLGLGIIAALTPDHWEVEILDENFESFSYRKADLVGITAYTTSANRAYQIAAVYRSEGIPTVMGGIHASLVPEEALQYMDVLVIGEAENIWEEVIKDFESGNLQQVYRGGFPSLTELPHPRRDLFNPNYALASIQTTRGCPMHCEFCSVSEFNGRKYRKRPVEDVLEELEHIPQRKLFFVDDNLVGNDKEDEERAIALFKGMIERNLNKRWACQTSLNVARNEEVLHYAAQSGCKMMLIGIESETTPSLELLGKKLNLKKVDRYNEILALINRHKIAIQGGVIFGADTDRLQDLHNRAQYMKHARIDVMQPTILTPYPGTALYRKYHENDRLIATNYPYDWEKYDMAEIVYQPALMGVEEMRKNMIVCWMSLINWWNIFCKFIKTLIFTKNLETAIWALLMNIVYRGMGINKIKEWKKDNI